MIMDTNREGPRADDPPHDGAWRAYSAMRTILLAAWSSTDGCGSRTAAARQPRRLRLA